MLKSTLPFALLALAALTGAPSCKHAEPAPETTQVSSAEQTTAAAAPAGESASASATASTSTSTSTSRNTGTMTAAMTSAAQMVSGDRPATKAACDACDGKWARHGLAEKESCICKTGDGGKVCKDGADCKGHCVAGEKDFKVVKKGPPPRGHYQGKCSDYDTVFGCHRFIPKGASKKPPQLAADAADQLCYD